MIEDVTYYFNDKIVGIQKYKKGVEILTQIKGSQTLPKLLLLYYISL